MSLVTRNALLALAITGAIIGTVFYAINYLNQERIRELSSIEDQLATDTLSLETQFALLEDASCEDLLEGNILSQEVSTLGDKLAFSEEKLGSDNQEVLRIKKQYTLFQIRDYLLTKKVATACDVDPTVVLYFYSSASECTDCDRAGYALSYMREKYPSLRVYTFDYDLDLGALKTMIAVEKVKPEFPAFVIEDKNVYGFESLEEFEKLFPKSLLDTASSTPKAASSTPVR